MLFEISEKAEKEISKYSDDYEIYLELEKVLQLDAQKNDLSFAKEEINIGIGIRIISENKLGFAYSSDINKIEDVAKKAYLNSKL
ncbi:MAG: TldD/PmbA family protein, partial [Methanobrevibacter arboriphilus]